MVAGAVFGASGPESFSMGFQKIWYLVSEVVWTRGVDTAGVMDVLHAWGGADQGGG
jgi:hypothetical protein